MARYRVLQAEDDFGRPIDTRIPYKATSAPWRTETTVVPDYLDRYEARHVHPVSYLNLQDWDTGVRVTSEEMLDYPKNKRETYVPPTPVRRETEETIINVVVNDEEEDFYVSKDSNTAYLVKCEELSIEAVVETRTGKWTVRGKGSKSYREQIVEAVKEFKK